MPRLDWESDATDTAAAGLRTRSSEFALAATALRAACDGAADAAGHEHVGTGVEEFARYWAAYLAVASDAADLLAQGVDAAAGAFLTTDQAASAAVR